jgi:hypothetical protein
MPPAYRQTLRQQLKNEERERFEEFLIDQCRQGMLDDLSVHEMQCVAWLDEFREWQRDWSNRGPEPKPFQRYPDGIPVPPITTNLEFGKLSPYERGLIMVDRFERAMNSNESQFKELPDETTIHDLMVWDCWPSHIIDAANEDRSELLTAKIRSHYGSEYCRYMAEFRPALKATVQTMHFDHEGHESIFKVINDILGIMVWG